MKKLGLYYLLTIFFDFFKLFAGEEVRKKKEGLLRDS